ncbi:MAG TPA: hypothetical protein VIY52_15765 [Streptosporangiaceae bacterium]
MKRSRIAQAVADISAALAIAGVGTTACAASGVAAAPAGAKALSWHVADYGASLPDSTFSAVVATGKATGWAFAGAPFAYERTGAASWTRVKLPVGSSFSNIVAAAASSPGNVWAVNNAVNETAQVLKWNGFTWSRVKTLPGWNEDVSVPGGSDVWVFNAPSGSAEGGVWHFTGRAWTRVSATYHAGFARTDTDVWAFTAFSGATMAHFNGTAWTTYNLAGLLPPGIGKHNHAVPHLAAVLALSATDVYAVDVGDNGTNAGGPLVVLHYDGHAWAKVAGGNYGDITGSFSADGDGGLWIPALKPDGLPALLHYSAGKLTPAAIPANGGSSLAISSVSQVPGTAGQLAGGEVEAADGPLMYADLLQYS